MKKKKQYERNREKLIIKTAEVVLRKKRLEKM